MSNFIKIKPKAVPDNFCEEIVNLLNTEELKRPKTPSLSNFYRGVKRNIYECPWRKYLFDTIIEYKEEHPFLDSMHNARWKIDSICNYQKYEPAQYYASEHCEQGRMEYDMRRMLVWMFYCNTVQEGGETFFPQQDINVKPEKGTLVIWPAAWTHSHRGKTALKEDKYIVTGWASYIKDQDE